MYRTLADGPATLTVFDPRFQLDFENDNLFDVYATAVAEYTKRALTNSDDKLKAMNGLFNLLEYPFRGPFHFGVPTTLFDVGLLWMPVHASSRSNMQFPSWSWAGWSGAARYAMNGSMNNMCECTISQATIESKNGVKLCSEIDYIDQYSFFQGENDNQWKRQFDEETLEIHYELLEAESYQYRYPRPLSTVAEDVRRHLKHENSGVLKIHGMTGIFRLTDKHVDMYVPWSTCRPGHHQQCHLAVLDTKGQVAGVIFVDGRTAPQLMNQSHKFLALSRSTLYRTDIDAAWDDETNSFRSWTHPLSGLPEELEEDGELINEFGFEISRSECFGKEFNARVFWPVLNVLLLSELKNGVVERVGIGKIHVDAFFPIAKKETIMLC